MVNAIIEGETATLELKVKIPKHYLEFFDHLEETYGFDESYLAKSAADGIIMDMNGKQEAMHEALEDANPTIKPELPVGSKNFAKAEGPE